MNTVWAAVTGDLSCVEDMVKQTKIDCTDVAFVSRVQSVDRQLGARITCYPCWFDLVHAAMSGWACASFMSYMASFGTGRNILLQ